MCQMCRFSRQSHDLFLIHADERAQDGKIDDILGHAQGLHRLRRDLTEVLARDERLGLDLIGHALGDAHHKAAHDEREEFLGAVSSNLLLDLGKRHDLHRQPPAPGD